MDTKVCTHSNLNKVAVIEFYQCESCSEVLYSFNKLTLNLSFNLEQWNTFVKQLMVNFNLSAGNDVSEGLQCKECGKCFESTEAFNEHKTKNPLVCEICFQIFSCQSTFKDHQDIHMKKKPLRCNVCEKHFTEKRSLEKHLKLHQNKSVENNRIPLYKSVDSLKLRKSRFNVKRNFKCNFCVKSFACNNQLQTHIRTHTGEKPFKCNYCDRAFTDPSARTRHHLTHTGEKNHKCDVCGKAFAVLGNLRRHYVSHTGEKPYPCKICGEQFKDPYHLKRHARIHTGETHKCDTCGMSFFVKRGLNEHRKTHHPVPKTTKDDPIPTLDCTFCDKKFTYPSQLKKHIVKHTGEKPYECDVCGKKYSQSTLLFTHKKIHSGDKKPHECDICGKRFYVKRDRDRHRNSTVHKIHTGPDKQPLHCDVCGESFADLNSLRSHSETHAGDEPHKCAVCGKSFAEASELVKHIKLHKKPEECVVCEKTFESSAGLLKHFQLHKKEKSTESYNEDVQKDEE